MRAHNPPRTYRLYLWRFDAVVTDPTALYGKRRVKKRGKCIGTYPLYKDLVADAERRTVAAGYAKSNWSDLFDWNV